MSSITTRNGTRLRWKELGEGRPVILIHGWSLLTDSWDPIMMKLADNGEGRFPQVLHRLLQGFLR
ncbi:alpha/beta fold hydrolase [Pseudoblastomonas flavescens]|uniref:alpha/beta fold hydrolase n=1 Tax=Alteriqipengyuania flavescens TaxID=3053610 RepID=UPI00299F88A6|nr:alpha/beta hydrolase [Alteriqipengyuania flavescens]